MPGEEPPSPDRRDAVREERPGREMPGSGGSLLLAAVSDKESSRGPRKVGIQKDLVASTHVHHRQPSSRGQGHAGIMWAGASAMNEARRQSSWGERGHRSPAATGGIVSPRNGKTALVA